VPRRAGVQPARRDVAGPLEWPMSVGDMAADWLTRTDAPGSPSTTEPLLEVTDLRVRFTGRGRRVHAVNGLSYRLHAGRMLAIVGESGSGKSVSSRALMGLLPPTATVTGSARFQGTELVGLSDREMRRHRGADLAMVFQDPTRSLNPTMRIGTQITEAVRAHAEVNRAAARNRALELLQLVRLPAPQ